MATLTYVYCLVRSARRPSTSDLAPAIGSAVRVLSAGERLWVIVSSVPAREYDEAALARGLQNLDWVGRRAMAHESVVEHFLGATAVLPMQLFTLFTSDERALEYVAGDRRRIDRILTNVERKVEWGLRLTFDEKAVRTALEEKHKKLASGRVPVARGRGAKGQDGLSGSSYLARKRDLLDVSRVHLAGARMEADKLYRAMAREAADARRRTATEQHVTPGSRVLLDAAFLVPTRRAGAFRSALRRNVRNFAGAGLAVSLTGPWPPYNFIDTPKSRRPGKTAPPS